jgi:hypothetical protein
LSAALDELDRLPLCDLLRDDAAAPLRDADER